MTFALVAVGGIGLAAGAAQGIIGSSAASSAANAQVNAAGTAKGELTQGYNTVAGLEAPASNLGYGAENILGQLYGINTSGTPGTSQVGGIGGPSSAAGPTSVGGAGAGSGTPSGTPNYSSFFGSPGYQFTLGQGESAINASAAAGGNLFSTATTNALDTTAQGLAGTQYNNYVNQLMNMAQLGQSAVGTTAGAATSTAASSANVSQGAGAASASGILGSASAINSGISTAGNSLMTALGNIGSVGSPNSSGVSPAGTGGLGALSNTQNNGFMQSIGVG